MTYTADSLTIVSGCADVKTDSDVTEEVSAFLVTDGGLVGIVKVSGDRSRLTGDSPTHGAHWGADGVLVDVQTDRGNSFKG